MLEVGADLVPAAQVEQEGQRVDVCRSAQKHGQLQQAGTSRTSTQTNKTRHNHLISSLTHATTFPEQQRYHQQWGGELWHKHLQRRGYKGSNDEHWVEDVRLEGEERQAHVGEDKVLCQEVEQLKQLRGRKRTHRASDKLILGRFLYFPPDSSFELCATFKTPLCSSG